MRCMPVSVIWSWKTPSLAVSMREASDIFLNMAESGPKPRGLLVKKTRLQPSSPQATSRMVSWWDWEAESKRERLTSWVQLRAAWLNLPPFSQRVCFSRLGLMYSLVRVSSLQGVAALTLMAVQIPASSAKLPRQWVQVVLVEHSTQPAREALQGRQVPEAREKPFWQREQFVAERQMRQPGRELQGVQRELLRQVPDWQERQMRGVRQQLQEGRVCRQLVQLLPVRRQPPWQRVQAVLEHSLQPLKPEEQRRQLVPCRQQPVSQTTQAVALRQLRQPSPAERQLRHWPPLRQCREEQVEHCAGLVSRQMEQAGPGQGRQLLPERQQPPWQTRQAVGEHSEQAGQAVEQSWQVEFRKQRDWQEVQRLFGQVRQLAVEQGWQVEVERQCETSQERQVEELRQERQAGRAVLQIWQVELGRIRYQSRQCRQVVAFPQSRQPGRAALQERQAPPRKQYPSRQEVQELLDEQTAHPYMRRPQLEHAVPTKVKPLLHTKQVVPILQLLHPLLQAVQTSPLRQYPCRQAVQLPLTAQFPQLATAREHSWH